MLADMLELGDYSERGHREVGAFAAKTGIDILVTVGERARAIAEGARSVSPSLDCRVCGTNAEAYEALRPDLLPGDTVLVKGSRGMRTEEIVALLLGSAEPAEARKPTA